MIDKGALYLFKELTDGNALFTESDTLKHCVFSYVESCSKGELSIFSMKKETNSKFQSLITIEVSKNKMIQMAGMKNRKPNQKELEIINVWSSQIDIQIEDDIKEYYC